MAGQSKHRDSVPIADYLRILRRHWWWIVLIAAAVPCAAYYFSQQQQKLYTASAQVLISNQGLPSNLVGPQNASNNDPTRWADTQARLAQVPPVAERTLSNLGLTSMTPSDFLGQSSVSADPNSDILTFHVTNRSPRLATALVNEYARQFIVYRRGLDTAVVRNALSGVASRISVLKRSIRHVKNPDPTIRQQLGVLLSKQQDLENLMALQGGNLFVVEAAHSADQTQPLTKRNVAAGLLAGIVIGAVIVMAVNAFDRRVRSGDEAAGILGVPLLGRIPRPPRKFRRGGKLVMREDPNSPKGEPFRKLRANIDFENLKI